MFARERLEERRTQVVRDLDELAEQVQDGQVEPKTAERLRGVFAQELAEIGNELAGLADVPVPEPDHRKETEPARGFSFRGVVGAALILAVLTVLIVWAGSGSGTDGADTEASSSVAIVDGGEISIATMTTDELENALASFPASVAVRLALADRHLADGDQQGALEHYLAVAMGEASPMEKSRALARVGYLSYATGQYEPARESLLESLELNRDNTEAMLYLGYVLLSGFDDAAGSIPYFEEVLRDPLMPPEIIDAVGEKLAEARERQG
ncbi:MAG: hypothetical protein M3112_03135 [Actinomycetia bacterium]|nr:hypothetical protein [Actinomycetes bacterium]